MESGVTYPDLRDLGHIGVLDSINVAQFKRMSYISVGRVVIPFRRTGVVVPGCRRIMESYAARASPITK